MFGPFNAGSSVSDASELSFDGGTAEQEFFGERLAVGLLANAVRQNTFEIERGTISLTNSAIYPVNNSATSVALAVERESGSYTVLTEVVSCSGNVGKIEITDKLANGFKIGYTGSATAAVVKYTVIRGYLK